MYDILKNDREIWDIFTLKDEYEEGPRDIYGRLPYNLASYKEIDRPVVSHYLMENGFDLEYPGGGNFAVSLSHDIDVLERSLPRRIYDTLATHELNRLKDNRRLLNFDRIMDLEERFDSTSTFFFLALRKGDRDFNYDIHRYEREIGEILDRGFEVGLHGGHGAYSDSRRMKDEKRRLEKAAGDSIKGYRNHFLRFEYPETWRALRECGIEYDSTLGYANAPGYKNGICYPFKPYDRTERRAIDIWELPLSVMDRTLIGRMGLDGSNSFDVIKRLVRRVKDLKGVITINWHNSVMSGENGKLYERLLKFLTSEGGWISNCGEIVDFYRREKLIERF